MKIKDLNLSPKAYSCLKKAGYTTLEKLKKANVNDLFLIEGLDKRSFDEVLKKLKDYGINLKNLEIF